VPLTDRQCKNALPQEKAQKLNDEKGLFLLISPAGGKWWRFRYRFAGQQNSLALGTYPSVSLEGARQLRDAARTLLADGKDPSQARREEKGRERAALLATKANSRFRISVAPDGQTEIWKGSAMVSLSADETRSLHAMLAKFLA